jgi:cell division septal protein FtsQ
VTNRRVKTKRPAASYSTPSEEVDSRGAVEGAPSKTGRAKSIAKFVVGLSFVLGLAGVLAWVGQKYALTSPRFSITTLEVSGNRRLAKADVEEIAGVRLGNNLFGVSLDVAESRLENSPWISSAKVERRLPGYLKIDISEEEPVAIVVFSGQSFLVSREGVPFKALEAKDPFDFPAVTGITKEQLADNRVGVIERLKETALLLEDYARLPLAESLPVEEVSLDPGGQVRLVIGRDGMELHLGKAPFKQKLLRAARVIGKAQSEGGVPSSVFLDNTEHPERVVVRVR